MKRTLRTLLALTLVLGLMAGLMSVAEAKTATRITMSRRTLSMDWGTRYTLAVTVTPTNASDKSTIAWNSSDPALIQVQADASSRKALVTVRGKASLDEPYPLTPVVITATTSMGKMTTCTITLKQIDVKSISVSPSSKTVYLTKSQPTYQMPKPTFNPSLAGDQVSYTWSTNNAAVATVDAATGLVTFTGEGTARITATYTSGAVTVSDFCTFVVKPIRVKSISLDETIHYMGQGENLQLTAKVISAVSGKLPSYDKVTWSSEDESIAKVDENGKVTAQSKSGIVKITASVDKGNYVKTARCMVYVRDASPVRVTITAGGDCVLGGDPRKTGITARSTQARYQSLIRANGSTYPFEKITKLFGPTGGTGAPNLSIVNLEVCLTTKGGSNPTTDRKFVFRGDPSNAQAFAVGIDIANIANNHSADFGMSSFDNTASSVKKYSDAEPSGYNRYSGANYVPVKEVGGKRIGFYGIQANQVPLSLVESRIKKVKSDNRLDLLVLTIHWTGQQEYVRPVTSTMKAYSRKAIDSGADVVLGHHRHDVSGIERYKGKYIFYDLGSLATGGGSSCYTYAVQIDFDISNSFTETAQNGEGVRIYPLYATSGPAYAWNKNSKKYEHQSNNWQPVPPENAIRYIDHDTNAPFADKDIFSSILATINKFSPTGPDGRFDATNYLRNYSDLP